MASFAGWEGYTGVVFVAVVVVVVVVVISLLLFYEAVVIGLSLRGSSLRALAYRGKSSTGLTTYTPFRVTIDG